MILAVFILAACVTGKTLKVELAGDWATTSVVVDVTGTGGTPHQIDLQSAGPAGCNKTNWNHDRVVNVSQDKLESVRNLTPFTHYRFLYDGKVELEGKTKADPEASPEPVRDLKVSSGSASEITLSWQSYKCSSLSGPFERFWTYRDGENVGNLPDMRTTSFTFDTLRALTTYKLGVAVDTEGLDQPVASTSVNSCTDAEDNAGTSTLTQASGLRPKEAVMTWNQPETFSTATHRLKISCNSTERAVRMINDSSLVISGLKESSVYDCVAVIQDTSNVQCGKETKFSIKTKLVVDVDLEVTRGETITFVFSGNFKRSFLRKGACNGTQSPDLSLWTPVSSPHQENSSNQTVVCLLFVKSRGAEKAYKYADESLGATSPSEKPESSTEKSVPLGLILGVIAAALVIAVVITAVICRQRRRAPKDYRPAATTDREYPGYEGIGPNQAHNDHEESRPQPVPRSRQPPQ